MKLWEYKQIWAYPIEIDEVLLDLGKQGWELVSVVFEKLQYTSGREHRLFFKRPIEKPRG